MYYPFEEYIGIYLKGCVSAEILLPSRHSERQHSGAYDTVNTNAALCLILFLHQTTTWY